MKKNENSGKRIPEEPIKDKQELKQKKRNKNQTPDPSEKSELWLKRFFDGLLYYRSERTHYSPSKNYPQVRQASKNHK